MSSVKNGDTVTVNYIGKLQNGIVIATSKETVAKENQIYSPNDVYKPVSFVVGEGKIIKGIDEGVVGMEKGDQKEITIPPEKGFGDRDEELMKKFPAEAFVANQIQPRKGMVIRMAEGVGEIVEVQEDFAVLDFNHPLSGKTLVFDVTVEDVQEG